MLTGESKVEKRGYMGKIESIVDKGERLFKKSEPFAFGERDLLHVQLTLFHLAGEKEMSLR